MSCLLDGPIALEGWKVEGIIFNISRKQTSTIESHVCFFTYLTVPLLLTAGKGKVLHIN